MKKIKKLLIAGCMIALLGGCGEENSNPSNQNNPVDNPVVDPTPDPEPKKEPVTFKS